ncbi:hypothetical protein [Geoalkalibacter sp.]|uniref:hypothetical protein n=1 Tax=Geoalkalibacter sp. TaxID=3041440 RepID=UPI00272E3406|nr:hypothetical protein [Geoalkalibacter sp.]
MTPGEGAGWSAPDGEGVRTLTLDVGAKSTLRGKRRRRAQEPRLASLGLWPAAWRDLLRDWLRQGGSRRKWLSLLQSAGGERASDALQLLDALLKTGLVEVEEQRSAGRWQAQWVEFLDLEATREALGLPHRERLRERCQALGEALPGHPLLHPLHASLLQIPAERALRRYELLSALDVWLAEERSGTRRDFALFARGDTKEVSAAEWNWLADFLDLEACGISRHTPALWLRAPLVLHCVEGALDLRCVPDAIALTPATLARLKSGGGILGNWRVVENRTLFERVARHWGERDGVLWVPGFAPSWWRQAVAALLAVCPAPALVACDPDPAGIEIALQVGRLWEQHNLPWGPWLMTANNLAGLRSRKALTDHDRERLARLVGQPLPVDLRDLVAWMDERGEKGEQEGIADLEGEG